MDNSFDPNFNYSNIPEIKSGDRISVEYLNRIGKNLNQLKGTISPSRQIIKQSSNSNKVETIAVDAVATSNVVLNGSQTIDGVTNTGPTDDKRFLLTAQTNQYENGVWESYYYGDWFRQPNCDYHVGFACFVDGGFQGSRSLGRWHADRAAHGPGLGHALRFGRAPTRPHRRAPHPSGDAAGVSSLRSAPRHSGR